MKKDWSMTLFPSGSSRLNLKEKLPPLSPFSWMYSTCPDRRGAKPQETMHLCLEIAYGWLCMREGEKDSNGGKTFVDVFLGKAGDRSFDRYLSLVFACIQQQGAHTQVFSKGEPQLKVIWIYVRPFQMLLCDLRWGACWEKWATVTEMIQAFELFININSV